MITSTLIIIVVVEVMELDQGPCVDQLALGGGGTACLN